MVAMISEVVPEHSIIGKIAGINVIIPRPENTLFNREPSAMGGLSDEKEKR